MLNVPFPDDTYTSAPRPVSFLARCFTSLYFYWRVFGIIRHDGNLARQGAYGNEEWTQGSMDTLRLLEDCGMTVHVEGMRHIDETPGPCVFIGNHMSTLETFVLPVFIQPRKHVTFVVKESLLNYPWFGPVLQSRNPIAIGRETPRHDLAAVLEGGEQLLQSGCSIIVFPQRTRSYDLDPEHFGSIGVKLARRAKVPIIPIALRTDAWGIGPSFAKDLGPIRPEIPIRFSFGAPLTVEGNGKKEHAEVCSFIAERLRQWNLPVPAQPGA